VASIDLARSQAAERLRREVSGRTAQALDLLDRLLGARRDRSKAETGRLLLEAVRALRYNGGRGYYFVFDTRGGRVLPSPQAAEAAPAAGRADDSERLRREMIDLALARGQGFLEYGWSKPGVPGTDHRKIAHVAHFAPLGWVVGTGEYLEDVEQDIRDEVLERLARRRIGVEGYLFGVMDDGDPLFTNGRVTRGTGNLLTAGDPVHAGIIRAEIDAGWSRGRLLPLLLPRLNGGPALPKLSYALAYKPWGWIIGAGNTWTTWRPRPRPCGAACAGT
jgi:signal transduction histidine kinase